MLRRYVTVRDLVTGKEKLSKGVSDQKWDRVKIICTQPFNKVHAVRAISCMDKTRCTHLCS